MLPLSKVALSVHTLDRAQISRAKPTWGLDEALLAVPGVYVANRYNFSQDQRISIRGFGARSARHQCGAGSVLRAGARAEHLSGPIGRRGSLGSLHA